MVKVESKTAIFGGLGIAALIAAAFFLVKEVREAGKDLFDALPELDIGLRESIADITESIDSAVSGLGDFAAQQQANLDSFFQQQQTNFQSGIDDLFNFFQDQEDNSSVIAGETVVQPDGTIVTIPGDTVINPDGTVTSETPPTQTLSEQAEAEALAALEAGRAKAKLESELDKTFSDPFFGDAELIAAANEAEFQKRLAEQAVLDSQIAPVQTFIPIESELENNKEFLGGGLSFIGGTIRENPIDTFGEVLEAFPELTASQISDFLAEFSGILPSELDRIDPDIRNIAGGFVGGGEIQSFEVDTTTTISELDEQERIASCTTCQLFGLNCEKCQIASLTN